MEEYLEKLTKVLELERRQGFTDGAVIGGLGAFLEHWQEEARDRLPSEMMSRVVDQLDRYAGLTPEERRVRLEAVLDLAQSDHAAPERPAPETPAAHSGPQPATVTTSRSEGRADRVAPQAAGPRRQDDPELDRPVIHLRGFGKKAAANLGRLGIESIRDLLYHAPARYNDFRRLKTINQLEVGEEVTIVGTVWDVRRKRGRAVRDVLTVVLNDTTATIACTFFNQPYLEREFQTGRRVVVSGRVESWAGRLVFRSPEWERLDRDLVHTGRLVPVYPLTQGVTQRWLRGRMKHVVDPWSDRVGDPLPAELRERHGLVSLPNALRSLHFPQDEEELAAARRRLAFDELTLLQLWSRRRRRAWSAQPGMNLASGRAALDRYVADLPFSLTGAQGRVLEEIAADLASKAPMSRLLQGDVGSGKTAVAAGALVMAVAAGAQAALMAPTEILSEQHFGSLGRFLEPQGYRPFDPSEPATPAGQAGGPIYARLVGGMRASEKAAVVEALRAGTVDLLIGTHALIQEGVSFRRLGLAVVDEQHRFGVLQRAELPLKATKGAGAAAGGLVPHLLIMTATPIPRTLAMVLNADLDQSVIDELPPGRKPVRTLWLQGSERERAYQFIRHRVRQGEQAYVVLPLVEDSEVIDAPAAVATYDHLHGEVWPDLQVGLVHGRMSPAEKEGVMAAFHAGEIEVLVATSVIEVGVDVPNATVMLIDGADRFGLAQLHQFRGRVGRGEVESVCLLVADDPSPAASRRIEALSRTTNGLELAELDLEMRGPGDYFGIQQSGEVDRFRFARGAPTEVLVLARTVADEIMQQDPELQRPEFAMLRERVEAFQAAAERA